MNKSTEKRYAIIFGVSFLGILLAIALLLPEPSDFQYMIIRVVLALAGAATATMISGFIQVQIPNVGKATGALGIFAVIYFFSPAQMVTAAGGPAARRAVITTANHELIAGRFNVEIGYRIVGLRDHAKIHLEVDDARDFERPHLVSEELAHDDQGNHTFSVPPGQDSVFVRLFIGGPNYKPVRSEPIEIQFSS